MKAKNLSLEPRALLAELVGTLILVLVAVTVANPIIVGFVLVVLVLAVGAISGAHLNPAVTFGLWSVKKLESIKLPFYWAAQILGALFALLIIQMFSNADFSLSLASFSSFENKLVAAELLGTAVFTFAIAAAVHRGLADAAKSLAIGFGLLAGLAVGGGLLGQALQNVQSPTSENQEVARITKVDGVTLNPAVALAATEKAEQQGSLDMLGQEEEKAKEAKQPASRLTLETIVGTLLGGAIGMNLYFVSAGVNPFTKNETVATKATKVVKKVKGKK